MQIWSSSYVVRSAAPSTVFYSCQPLLRHARAARFIHGFSVPRSLRSMLGWGQMKQLANRNLERQRASCVPRRRDRTKRLQDFMLRFADGVPGARVLSFHETKARRTWVTLKHWDRAFQGSLKRRVAECSCHNGLPVRPRWHRSATVTHRRISNDGVPRCGLTITVRSATHGFPLRYLAS